MLASLIAISLVAVGLYVALNNGAFVDVVVFGTTYDQPVAVVIILSLGLGLVAGFLAMLTIVIGRSITIAKLRRTIREYEIANEADKDVVYRSAGLGQDGENII